VYSYRARWYLPEAGVFGERDPAGYLDASDPYAAFGWNPFGATDPSGRMKICAYYHCYGLYHYDVVFETSGKFFFDPDPRGMLVSKIITTVIRSDGVVERIAVQALIEVVKKGILKPTRWRGWVATDPGMIGAFFKKTVKHPMNPVLGDERWVASGFERRLEKAFTERVPKHDSAWYYTRDAMLEINAAVKATTDDMVAHREISEREAAEIRAAYDVRWLMKLAREGAKDRCLVAGDTPEHPMKTLIEQAESQ